MRHHRTLSCVSLSLIFGLLPTTVLATDLPKSFTLGRYVPADAWLYVHGVDNPERAWLEEEWAEVWDALKASGVHEDIMALVSSAVNPSDEQKEEAEATIKKWTDLVFAVNWSDLVAKEAVYAQRTPRTARGMEHLALLRGAAGSGESNGAALAKILDEIAALTDVITYVETTSKGASIWSLSVPKAEAQGMGVDFSLFRKGDIIGLVSDKPGLDQVLAMLEDETAGKSVLDSPRFKAALSDVPAPEDFMAFFDGKTFLGDIKRLIKMVTSAIEVPEGSEAQTWVAMSTKVLDIVDIMDYTITTVETDGRRQLTHVVSKVQSEKRKCALASCCMDRKQFQQFDKFIPADATSFSMSGFVDLEGVYDFILGFIKTDVPGGTELVAQWDGMLASVGFDPKTEIFSWWSGEMMQVSMPPAVVTAMGGADSVTMIRVKDSAIAAQKVNAALDFVGAMMQAKGQMLMMTPASVDAEGFREVTHPMAAMFLRPVIGVKGDWLIIGTSSSAVNRCLSVAAGKSPSITKNARFLAEGIMPKGPVSSCSFMDTSKMGEEVGQALGMVGMFGGMAASSMPPKEREMFQKVLGIVMKLGPVMQKIDFFSSESSVTTMEGADRTRTENVVTYKSAAATGSKSAERN